MDSLGWVKYRMGDTDRRDQGLQQGVRHSAERRIGAHLGEVLEIRQSGREARARCPRSALKPEPDNETLVKTLQRLQVNDL